MHNHFINYLSVFMWCIACLCDIVITYITIILLSHLNNQLSVIVLFMCYCYHIYNHIISLFLILIKFMIQ